MSNSENAEKQEQHMQRPRERHGQAWEMLRSGRLDRLYFKFKFA